MDKRSFWCGLLAAVTFAGAAAAQTADTDPNVIHRQWPHFQEVPLTGDAPPEGWSDFVLTPPVFDGARLDLGDLRLYDAAGIEVPYVLRVRRAEYTDVTVSASEFNRTTGADGSSELTLDLGADPPEHNELEAHTPGVNYRRRAQLEGSTDGQEFRLMLEHDLVHFETAGQRLIDRRIIYPPSRYRYLRLRVFQDPRVDQAPVELGEVTIHRKVELPGEYVTLPAKVGPREAVRAPNGPGSAWIIDLGANQQPCEALLVTIGDAELARDYLVEASGPAEAAEPFYHLAGGQWRRRAGEPRVPLMAELGERAASRLRLVVTDYRNPPLDMQGAEYRAAARQIVFARTAAMSGPLRLYYGNPTAEPPHYELERILPARIDPAPQRLSLGGRQANPNYVPTPLALSERWPWLIYVVLSAACLALGAILVNLGRAAVAQHDAHQPAGAEA